MKRFAGGSVAIAFFALLALLPRCVDTSPLPYVPVDATVGGATSPACVSCLTSEDGACWSAYEPCAAIPECNALMRCLLDKGCLTFLEPTDRVTCGLACIENQTIGATDPTVLALTRLNFCALESCNDVCITQ